MSKRSKRGGSSKPPQQAAKGVLDLDLSQLGADDDIEGATPDELRLINDMVTGIERLTSCPFRTLYPDTGPLRRELYWWAMEFWQAGLVHKERGMMAANQVGKTLAAGFEVTAHLTGQYPDWWPGWRFPGPTKWWLAGDTKETTRDILQTVMLGPIDGVDDGDWRGMIPADTIVKHTRKTSVAKAVDAVWIRHVSGGQSVCQFRSYDQGRRAFQGVPLSGGVWMDEEPPDPEVPQSHDGSGASGDIYSECLTRLAATDGLLLWTFTPLRGMTPFVQGYLDTAVTVTKAGKARAARDVFFPDEADPLTVVPRAERDEQPAAPEWVVE